LFVVAIDIEVLGGKKKMHSKKMGNAFAIARALYNGSYTKTGESVGPVVVRVDKGPNAGEVVGTGVGDDVGETVGEADEPADGDGVGETVGEAEGAAVEMLWGAVALWLGMLR
jgi:hypothetical protein